MQTNNPAGQQGSSIRKIGGNCKPIGRFTAPEEAFAGGISSGKG